MNGLIRCGTYIQWTIAAAAKTLQLCPTLCNPIDGSPPSSPIPGILQARVLEWVAISFSNAWKWKVKVKSLSRFRLLATPWTAAYQAPPSMGFSRQEYWSGLPLPSPLRSKSLHIYLRNVAFLSVLNCGFSGFILHSLTISALYNVPQYLCICFHNQCKPTLYIY